MKILFFAIGNIATPRLEAMLELISDHIDKGDEVFILTCNGSLGTCYVNPYKLKSVCFSCKLRFKLGVKLLNINSSNIFFLKSEVLNKNYLNKEFKSIEELKQFEVDGINLGFGVVSFLISALKDHIFDLNLHRNLIFKLLRSSILVQESFLDFLNKMAMDSVYLFNGRFFDVWPVVQVCKKLGINFYIYEMGGSYFRYLLVKNQFSHDLGFCKKDIECSFDGCDKEKIEIGKTFFMDKRNRQEAIYCYTKEQQLNLLPKLFDKNKKNIIIFNSSRNEFEAFDSYKMFLYNDEIDAVRRIVNDFKYEKETKFYLRVHPNLKDLNNSQINDLKRLDFERHSNLEIIWPEDVVDSYALLDNCDKALVFLSTMGVEACFWGKTSILLAPAFYEDLDCCYKPKSHEEVIKLIKSDLKPLNKRDAIKYGYWVSSFGVPYKKFKPDGPFSGKFMDTNLWDRFGFINKMKLKSLIARDRFKQLFVKKVIR